MCCAEDFSRMRAFTRVAVRHRDFVPRASFPLDRKHHVDVSVHATPVRFPARALPDHTPWLTIQTPSGARTDLLFRVQEFSQNEDNILMSHSMEH